MQIKTACLATILSRFALSEAVRRYNLTLSYAWDKQGASAKLHCVSYLTRECSLTNQSPDGHGRPTYLINGDTPGPVLVVDEGETLEAFVDNQLAIETTLHWYFHFAQGSCRFEI